MTVNHSLFVDGLRSNEKKDENKRELITTRFILETLREKILASALHHIILWSF